MQKVGLRITWRTQTAERRHVTERALHALQGGGPEVTYEDQQRINAFNRTFQRAKEVAAEIKVKQARARTLPARPSSRSRPHPLAPHSGSGG
jgi:hypothetical protein